MSSPVCRQIEVCEGYGDPDRSTCQLALGVDPAVDDLDTVENGAEITQRADNECRRRVRRRMSLRPSRSVTSVSCFPSHFHALQITTRQKPYRPNCLQVSRRG